MVLVVTAKDKFLRMRVREVGMVHTVNAAEMHMFVENEHPIWVWPEGLTLVYVYRSSCYGGGKRQTHVQFLQ